MLKRPTMKEILFPERGKIKMNFEHHQRNLRFIKDLENANKEEKKIQEEIEKQKNSEFDLNNINNENNNQENKIEHFKMKMFENVPSRYLKNTEKWIFNQNKMRKLPPIKKYSFLQTKKNNKSNNVLFHNSKHKNNNSTINYNTNNNNNNESLFEKYYVKMLKKNINYSNSQENLFYSQPIINNIGSHARKSNKKYLPPINIF